MDERKIKELENSDFITVFSYVKRSNCFWFSDCRYFWQSKLPIKWFDEFSNNESFKNLLFGYFSNNENANNEFINKIIKTNDLVFFIKIIKQTQAFKHELHWKSFSLFKQSSDLELKQLYQELKFIKNYRLFWKNEFSKFDSIIFQLSFEDLLIQTISYYERFKRFSNKSLSNRDTIISYEFQLINILNDILNIKIKNINHRQQNKYSIVDFNSKVSKTLPPKRPTNHNFQNPNFIPNEKIDIEKSTFRNLIDFLIQKDINEYQIQLYLNGYATFEIIDNLDAELLTNERYLLYKKTLEKSKYDEIYFNNSVLEDKTLNAKIKTKKEIWKKEFIRNKFAVSKYLNFLSISSEIMYAETKIDLLQVIELLKTFSIYLIPQGRIIHNNTVIQPQAPKRFKELFNIDYIVGFEEKELISKIGSYFKWGENTVKNILSFWLSSN